LEQEAPSRTAEIIGASCNAFCRRLAFATECKQKSGSWHIQRHHEGRAEASRPASEALGSTGRTITFERLHRWTPRLKGAPAPSACHADADARAPWFGVARSFPCAQACMPTGIWSATPRLVREVYWAPGSRKSAARAKCSLRASRAGAAGRRWALVVGPTRRGQYDGLSRRPQRSCAILQRSRSTDALPPLSGGCRVHVHAANACASGSSAYLVSLCDTRRFPLGVATGSRR